MDDEAEATARALAWTRWAGWICLAPSIFIGLAATSSELSSLGKLCPHDNHGRPPELASMTLPSVLVHAALVLGTAIPAAVLLWRPRTLRRAVGGAALGVLALLPALAFSVAASVAGMCWGSW